MSFFQVNHQSAKTNSRARTGVINTAHGTIQTPAFVSVATKGTIKSLTPAQLKDIGVQASFVNSYHLAVHPGTEIILRQGSIHTFSNMSWSLLSDSGGFQVFSLAKKARRGKFRDGEETILVSLGEDKVIFRSLHDGTPIEFTPESSIQHQINIGADMIMAFDECTYHPATEAYTKKALKRTHDWLVRCIEYKKKHARSDYPQYLYGVIQGGAFERLRVESAQFIDDQDTDGVAIGGVSVGETKAEMRNQVKWVSNYLPQHKPVHLLGVGQLDDIIDLVKHGIDTFDCVEPTRLARMGVLLSIQGIDGTISDWTLRKIDITSRQYFDNIEKIDSPSAYVGSFSYAYVYHLFKQKELLAYTLATMHNLAVMELLMSRIRQEIERNNI